MKTTTMPIDAVLAWLAANQPGLEYEVDRAWVWITTDLSPLHKKCECAECAERKSVRDSIKGKEIGFIFARDDHPLPSGKTARWAHHTDKPMRFTRKGKKGDSEASTEKLSGDDAALLAALMGS